MDQMNQQTSFPTTSFFRQPTGQKTSEQWPIFSATRCSSSRPYSLCYISESIMPQSTWYINPDEMPHHPTTVYLPINHEDIFPRLDLCLLGFFCHCSRWCHFLHHWRYALKFPYGMGAQITAIGTTYPGWQPYNSPSGQSSIGRPYSSYDP